MKKKGFTLIELLAVIVILAIIALIVTPLVLKYIEKSRQESKVDSAYSFVRNLETEIANYSIKNNGKKYTTDKENIKELGLDITVKGENPEDGKVCISSVGQVEKAILQYGKYYVSYDGKKASITTDVDLNSFSCGETNDVLFGVNADFEYIVAKDDEYSGSSLDISSLSLDKLKKGYEYDLLIDDEFVTKVLVLNLDGYVTIKSIDFNKDIDIEGDSEELYVWTSFKIEGEHNIKISNEQEPQTKALLYVKNSGSIILNGLNFTEGKAHILITDEDNTKYFDDYIDLVINGFDNIYGVDSPCRENITELPNVFTAAANGKKITAVITQEVAGKEVITTINCETKYIPHSEYDAYYWGQYALVADGWC